ncbi:hypothetical protein GWK47_052874 [Chionoecetes opilio]|uniref:Uncharacterized protein n=1 Tax=Chionoecetes opilio TaxID=41210 RepID=A0A8J4Y157_CHIOP|nr:hypothetical protein GWK47_052874 [Chionoecetes opilio]
MEDGLAFREATNTCSSNTSTRRPETILSPFSKCSHSPFDGCVIWGTDEDDAVLITEDDPRRALTREFTPNVFTFSVKCLHSPHLTPHYSRVLRTSLDPAPPRPPLCPGVRTLVNTVCSTLLRLDLNVPVAEGIMVLLHGGFLRLKGSFTPTSKAAHHSSRSNWAWSTLPQCPPPSLPLPISTSTAPAARLGAGVPVYSNRRGATVSPTRLMARRHNIVSARLRLGYRPVWQVSEAGDIPHFSPAKLCDRPRANSLQHYCLECPSVGDMLPQDSPYSLSNVMACERRSKDVVWLLEKSPTSSSPGNRLPSRGEVLQVFLFHHIQKEVLFAAAASTAEKVLEVWRRANIPTSDVSWVKKKILKLYEEYGAWRIQSRKTETEEMKRCIFRDSLEDMFDIAHSKAMEAKISEEDKAFLETQREDWQSCSMAGVDEKLKRATEEKRRKRQRMEEMKKEGRGCFVIHS